MRIITGHQLVYLPWLGLFHKILLADVFVFMDDVQYLKEDWNNRNRIKDSHGEFWLTVPVRLKDSSSRKLKDILIDHEGKGTNKHHWQNKHWLSIQSCYRKSPYWVEYAPFFEEMYTKKTWKWLAELNEYILRYLLNALEIKTEIIKASSYGFEGIKSELVLDHCRKLGAEIVVLGAQGRNYIVEEDYLNRNISIYYQNYRHPQYKQRFGHFVSHMSVIDLLFNCGPESLRIIQSHNIGKKDLIDYMRRQKRPLVIDSSLVMSMD